MNDLVRYIKLRFEIQHLFPSGVTKGTNDSARAAQRLLKSVKFDFESIGNKMALLASSDMHDALRNTPPSVQQAFVDARFGWNTQNSVVNSPGGPPSPAAHPEYNRFVIDVLSQLSRDAHQFKWDTTARERAVFDFHRYVAKINFEGIPPVQGTLSETFTRGWEAFREGRDYAALNIDGAQAIDDVKSAFDIDTIDKGTGKNEGCCMNPMTRHAPNTGAWSILKHSRRPCDHAAAG